MMRTAARVVIVTLALAGSSRASAQGKPAAREIAFIANGQDGTVTLLDVRARAVIGAIDVNPAHAVGDGPGARNYAQDTDVSPDGRTLYVSRGYLGDVAAFDIASGRLLWRCPLETGRADHMTLTADGRYLFVSAMMDDRVYRITTATGGLAGYIETGHYPHDNKVSHDGRLLYNTSIGDIASLPRKTSITPTPGIPVYPFQLTIVDVASLNVVSRTRLEHAIRPWKFTLDEKGIYAQLANEHAVVAYDRATMKLTRRLDLPVKPGITVADYDFEAPHHGLALTDDGRTLCLAGRASDYVALVRAPELTLITTIPVGDAPGWAEVADEGRVCLVTNTRSNDLSIISIAEKRELVRLPMGKGPKHVTVTPIPESVLAAIKANTPAK